MRSSPPALSSHTAAPRGTWFPSAGTSHDPSCLQCLRLMTSHLRTSTRICHSQIPRQPREARCPCAAPPTTAWDSAARLDVAGVLLGTATQLQSTLQIRPRCTRDVSTWTGPTMVRQNRVAIIYGWSDLKKYGQRHSKGASFLVLWRNGQ